VPAFRASTGRLSEQARTRLAALLNPVEIPEPTGQPESLALRPRVRPRAAVLLLAVIAVGALIGIGSTRSGSVVPVGQVPPVAILASSTAVAGPLATSTPNPAASSGPAVRASVTSGAGASAVPVVGTVTVHVTGEVRRPGLVRLPAGARIDDAIRATGGVRPGGRLGAVNLAAPLLDGTQIVVGGSPPSPGVGSGTVGGTTSGTTGSGSTDGAGPLNLNQASETDLDALPGVGPVMAGRILDARAARGGRFTSVDELREISGIGERTFARLSPLVTVG